MEKLHLRGLLVGYSPMEIAEKLNKNPQGLKSDLCSSIYKYVKILVDKCEEKIENWRKIREWLQEAGYNTYPNPQLKGKELVLEKSVVNVTNMKIEKNNLVFVINLKIPTISPTDKPELRDGDAEDFLK